METFFCNGSTHPLKIRAGFYVEEGRAKSPSLFLNAHHLGYHPRALSTS